MMNNSNNCGWGYSNTPPTNTLVTNITKNRQVKIDWLSISIDFLKIEKVQKNFFTIQEDHNYNTLLKLLGFDGFNLTKTSGKNGYSQGLLIGESVYIFYGADHIKNKFGNYTAQILLSGSACREFELYLKGSFKDLFKFLLKFDNTEFKRFDNALDVYDVSDLSIYDIEKKLRAGLFTSTFNKVRYDITENVTNEQISSAGFTIYLGTKHSNQLVMYDKLLEQRSKGVNVNLSHWERYEMRISGAKAKRFVEEYILAFENNSSTSYMDLVNQLLYKMLDIKLLSSDKNKSRWVTDPVWLKFLGHNTKIDLGKNDYPETSIENGYKWFSKNMRKMLSRFFIAFDGDEKTFGQSFNEILLDGFNALDVDDLSMINNYRISKGLKKIETAKDYIEMIKELINYDE